MRRALLIAAVLVLAAPGAASAAMKTFGADLNLPMNNTRTCAIGNFPDPAMYWSMYYSGVAPHQPYTSCTWWSVGTVNGMSNAVVPYGGGTVTKVRVKTGPTTGRMQVVTMRMIRQGSSTAEPGCCFRGPASQIFTPAPNSITEVPVDIDVVHRAHPLTGVFEFDVLGLSILDANVPMPAYLGGDGLSGGVMGMYPAKDPDSERLVNYGATGPGHVLLSADVDVNETTAGGGGGGVTDAAGDTYRRILEEWRKETAGKTGTGAGTKTGTAGGGAGGGTTTDGGTPAPIALAADEVAFKRGGVALKLACAAAKACRGRLVIVSVAKSGRRPALLGSGKVDIKAGKSRSVRAKLKPRARRALRRGKSLDAVAVVRFGGREVLRQPITIAR